LDLTTTAKQDQELDAALQLTRKKIHEVEAPENDHDD